jgi:putative DNA-invertase from lambdoid prophage Rac
MKVAIYCRVSTAEQSADNQLLALEKLARDRGWEVLEVYQEEESAWKAGRQRELARLLVDASRHRFEAVLVWALDRLTREGVASILRLVDTLKRYKVRIVSLQESWTEFPNELMAELFYSITGWVAKFESARRSERIKAGVNKRRAAGKPVGRPPGAKDKKPRRTTGYHLRFADRR